MYIFSIKSISETDVLTSMQMPMTEEGIGIVAEMSVSLTKVIE